MELCQEPGAVCVDEWGRAAPELARLSEHVQEGTSGSPGRSDRFFRKLDSFGSQNASTATETAIGERDIRRDRDISHVDSFGDPIIRCVEPAFYNDELDQIFRRHPQQRSWPQHTL